MGAKTKSVQNNNSFKIDHKRHLNSMLLTATDQYKIIEIINPVSTGLFGSFERLKGAESARALCLLISRQLLVLELSFKFVYKRNFIRFQYIYLNVAIKHYLRVQKRVFKG